MISKQKLDISSSSYKELLQLLPAPSRLIGGCVRDALLKKTSYDIDIATSLLPQQVIDILREAGVKVIPTGLQYGTVTAILKEERFEITTLRKDISTDGRRAKVLFTDSFEEDAGRRDFTINALSYCPFKEEIYDYFGGLADLTEAKVVFIGDPMERIREDFLRILRFFRFSCYYAEKLDQAGVAACQSLKAGLGRISRERIKVEMDKIIIHKKSPEILKEMNRIGVLPEIFPIKENSLEALTKLWQVKVTDPTPTLAYSLLLQEVDVKSLLALKFSKSEAKEIISFQETTGSWEAGFSHKALWAQKQDYLGALNAGLALGKISSKDAANFIGTYGSTPPPIFPVDGKDLLAARIPEIQIGKKLHELKRIWIASDFSLSKAELLKRI